MKTMRQQKLLFALLAMVLILGACKGESPTAPPVGGGGTPPPGGSTPTTTLSLTASNAKPVVDSTVTITAQVNINGAPAPNGTAVEFALAGDGGFEGTTGKTIIKTTTNGVATTTVTSSVAGTNTVTATINNVSKNVAIVFELKPSGGGPIDTTPSIESIVPAIGRPSGGETIRINGKNFKGPVRVLFDTGAPLPVEVFVVQSTETFIDVVSPAVNLGAGQQLVADVIVITESGTVNEHRVEREDGFTFRNEQLTPSISTATPNSGPVTGGTRVQIFGEGFQAPVQVLFGAAEARVITVRFDEIVVESPAGRDTSDNGSGTVTGPVPITVRNIASNTSTTMDAGFRYVAALQITAAGPTQGPSTGGTRISIDGIGFLAPVTVTVAGIAAQPIQVSGTKVIAITGAVDIEGCADVVGPIVVSNVVNGDAATGPQFTYDVVEPILINVTSTANPVVPGSPITVGVLNPGLFPRLAIGDTGVPIAGSTTTGDGLTLFTTAVPSNIVLDTETCPSGGTRRIATSFDITFTNVENDCVSTLPDGLTVFPPQIGQFFLTPNPLVLNATGDDPTTPENEEADASDIFTVVNTGNAPVTITSITSSDPVNFQVSTAAVGTTLQPCESTVVVVTYEAGAQGTTATATITVTGTTGTTTITARETVIGRTN